MVSLEVPKLVHRYQWDSNGIPSGKLTYDIAMKKKNIQSKSTLSVNRAMFNSYDVRKNLDIFWDLVQIHMAFPFVGCLNGGDLWIALGDTTLFPGPNGTFDDESRGIISMS